MTAEEEKLYTVHFECPKCEQRIETPESEFAKPMNCPTCGHEFLPYQAHLEKMAKQRAEAPKHVHLTGSQSQDNQILDATLWTKIIAVVIIGIALIGCLIHMVSEANGEKPTDISWASTAFVIGLLIFIIGVLVDIRGILLRKK